MKTATFTFTLFVSLFFGSLVSNQVISESPTCDDHDHTHNSHEIGLEFIENKNQWNSNIKYAAALGGLNYLFLEDNTLTYTLLAEKETIELHDILQESDEIRSQHMVPGHAYKVHFLNSLKPQFSGYNQRTAFNNYFIGNDPEKWAADVPLFGKVIYNNLYEGIELAAYSDHGNFKYDFIVAPNADPNDIQLSYEGVDAIYLKDDDLIIETSIHNITELKPYAYQEINGNEVSVECNYQLSGNVLSFDFPSDYNKNYPLVIDPTVIVATLTGTTGAGNFGHTATYDNAGNIYTGGISFGPGYPTTTGAFQTNYADGYTDIAVSKYNPDGSMLLYATYIGGKDDDFPHSTVVDFNGQLCILGDSDSADYPTTSNAVQSSHGGNVDIIVTKLNANGNGLVGSTYLGGIGIDGQNISELNENYGDKYRGEIVLDPQGNIYIASCSMSDNFPTTSFAVQPNRNNAGNLLQDGVLAKLNGDVSTLYWSTYLGGDDADMCFGLRVDDFGAVYVTGFAGGANFPMVPGGVQATWPGGEENAYVLKIASDGSSILNGTFWGSADGDEHSYFMDIDESDQIHIYGTSTGTMPVTPNTYFFNEGSNQFITALSNNLNTVIYSTVIGLGGSTNDFVPVAFMVDKCDGIYFSGYYGEAGLPTTSDAISTVGDAMYLGVLEPNAAGLSFATYYGEANHVDGGTSRFDKAGIVYQAVCSCDWNNTVMNTTSNAWATTQTDGECDVGVFKIDFEIETVTASALALPATSGCAPFTVDFIYTGEDAETIFWDFGTDSGPNTSTQFNPTYTFQEAGSYTVMQAVAGPNSCNGVDTFYLQIDVLNGNSTLTDTAVCFVQNSLFLDASTANATYEWQNGWTGAGFEITTAGLYWVETTIPGCTQRDSFNVIEGSPTVVFDASNPDCPDDLFGNIMVTVAQGGSDFDYQWSNGMTTGDLENLEPGQYSVTVTNEFGCAHEETFTIAIPEPITYDLVSQNIECAGYGNGWIDFQNISGGTPPFQFSIENEPFNNNPIFNNLDGGTYDLVIQDSNGCEETETVELLEPEAIWIEAGPDQTIKLGETTELDAIISDPTGQQIEWTPSGSLSCSDCEEPDAFPVQTTTYVLSVEAVGFGCVMLDSLTIFVEDQRNVYIPNIFSPNADGFNDMFYVSTDLSVSKINHLIIFDRWGSTIYEDFDFQPNDPRLGWDGTFKDRKMGDQVFVYVIDIEFVDGKTRLYKGDITLIQ